MFAYALMATVFIIGYLCIALEHPLKIDKAASAILTAVLCWTVLVLGADSILPELASSGSHGISSELRHHLGEVSEILFFLLGAMTIVELIDAHEGFKVITDRIRTSKRVQLLWMVGFITFFLSAALDNLTTTIVMVSLLRKLIKDQHERWFYAGIVVIAANAGGAWSPIGDVTTTMLWIGHQITASGIIVQLIIPSIVCLLVPLLVLSFTLKGEFERPDNGHDEEHQDPTTPFERNLVFILGILLAVSSLATAGHLTQVATALKDAFGNIYAINIAIGLLSSVVDNVPLVAGAMKMYPLVTPEALAAASDTEWLQHFVVNGQFWELLAYCAGTGGSCLIIGSAAGVAAMGMEKINFIWYLKRISGLALLGYLAGAATYMAMFAL